MAQKKILLIGNSSLELSLNMYRLPTPGESLADDGGIAYLPTGNVPCISVALRRLGVACAVCSRLGADAHGRTLFDLYKEYGVDTSYLKADRDRASGVVVKIREGEGAARKLYYSGANANLLAEDAADAFSYEPDMVCISLDAPAQTALSAARIAEGRGLPIVYLPADTPTEDYVYEPLPRSEFFVVNEEQAFAYTGIQPGKSDHTLRAALALYRMIKTRYLVITLAHRGAFLYDGKHYDMIPPALTVRRGEDPGGVGKAYCATLLAQYSDTADFRIAMKLAAIAGAFSVANAGGIASYPTTEDIRKFLRQ